jgi:hypothetical protein
MAFPWGLVSLLVGIVYGYVTPGRQDKMALLKKGIVIGVVLALVFAIVGFLLNVRALGVDLGAIGIFVEVVVLTILFVLGAWIGDVLEGAPKKV